MAVMCRLIRQLSPILALSMPALAAIGTAAIRVAATTAGNRQLAANRACDTTSWVSAMVALCVAVMGRRADHTSMS